MHILTPPWEDCASFLQYISDLPTMPKRLKHFYFCKKSTSPDLYLHTGIHVFLPSHGILTIYVFLSLDNSVLLEHNTALSAYSFYRVTWLQAPSVTKYVPSTQCTVLHSFNFVDTELFYRIHGAHHAKEGILGVLHVPAYEGGPPYC